ncbi:MAG: hypothetical protein JWN99_2383, partial [Ilumatobacteraceae bacterium]|nr:hypothetical protein [Ilumatobacteraceae bacterium]
MMVRTNRVGVLLLTTVLVAAGTVLGPATASAAPGDVVISEIMYNPVSDVDNDEFLELTNIGATAVDLSGWVFSGITLTFPAGATIPANGRLVVSPNAARTQATYGVTPAYVYTGKLSNSGEKVSLKSGTTTIDTVTFGTADPWPTTADGLGPSIELIDPTLDNNDGLNWASSTALQGTPGAANSVAGSGLGPRITLVSATPNVPAVNEPVVVSATIVGATATPTIKYRNDFAIEQSADMTLSATPNVYTATLPGAAAGHLIRYRIEATNAARTMRFPRIDDSEIYKGVVVADGVTSSIPVLDWFIADADYNAIVAQPEAEIDRQAVLAYNGTVFDNVTVNIRGAFTQTLPKQNWKFEMAKNHDLLLPGLVEPVDEWAMQADFVDGSHGRSVLSWDMYTRAGVDVSMQMFPVRTQRNAKFQGMYLYEDLFDGTWRDREGYSDDQFYKAEHGAFDQTRQLDGYRFDKKNPEDGDYSNIKELLDAIDVTGTTTTNYLLAHADIPEMINYAVVTALVDHQDSSAKNFYLSLESTTGRWEIIPWDLDHTWGLGCCNVNSNFVTPAEAGDQVSELMAAILAVPEWKAMYFRRLRTVTDQLLVPARLQALYDATMGPAEATSTMDFAAWPYPSGWNYANQRTSLFTEITNRKNVITGDSRVPAPQTAAPNIVINEIQHSPTGGNGAEFIELYNPSATEAVDLSGWVISGGVDMTIQGGAVILPKKTMVFGSDDPTFRSTYGAGLFLGGRFTGDLLDADTLTL